MSIIGSPKSELDTPALWVDLDCLESNVASLAAHFTGAGVNWRPHTKGIKIPAIAHMLINAGAMGVTCAKLGEAEIMASAGIKDILVANQVTGRHKLPRLAALTRHTDVKVAVDNPINIAAIGAAGVKYGVDISVVIEVNSGMERAGVKPGEDVLALAQLITDTPGVRFRGLMTWEGQTITIPDQAEKRRAIEQAIGLVTASAELCRSHGIPVEIVSGGGSGTYAYTPFLPGMTEIQAGGAIFSDVTYKSWGVQLESALFVQATVTSRPNPHRIICDAGYKTLPDNHGAPVPVGLDQKVVSTSFSAEHGSFSLATPNDSLQPGDIIDMVVGYGDATVYLHDVMYGVRNGIVETAWPILGRGKLQ